MCSRSGRTREALRTPHVLSESGTWYVLAELGSGLSDLVLTGDVVEVVVGDAEHVAVRLHQSTEVVQTDQLADG